LRSSSNSGNVTSSVVEGLYYSWIRKGEYVKARNQFEAWAKTNPNAAPIRLAAARRESSHWKLCGCANSFEHQSRRMRMWGLLLETKSRVLVDTGKREEADVIYKKVIDDYQKGLLKTKLRPAICRTRSLGDW